jgi:hypothetical protein
MENSTTINVTPRLISYYEVSILNDNYGIKDDSARGPPFGRMEGRRHRTECVAVGLATDSFHAHARMPGWDRQSFGYHGDDGGIFHSSGGMVKQFGSKFGAGDTIGCGIDFVAQGIFFTLNGKFLGYGWTGIDEEFLKNDLFPVVGLDTNCPLHLNFGAEEPFVFDLSSFIMKHETVIASQYSFENVSTMGPVPNWIGETPTPSFSSCSLMAPLPSSSSSHSRRSRFHMRGARDKR